MRLKETSKPLFSLLSLNKVWFENIKLQEQDNTRVTSKDSHAGIAYELYHVLNMWNTSTIHCWQFRQLIFP